MEAALRSLALGIVVWLATLVLRPRNPHLQKTIWITVLVASLAMPFLLKTRMAPTFDMPTSIITLTQSVNGTAAGRTDFTACNGRSAQSQRSTCSSPQPCWCASRLGLLHHLAHSQLRDSSDTARRRPRRPRQPEHRKPRDVRLNHPAAVIIGRTGMSRPSKQSSRTNART